MNYRISQAPMMDWSTPHQRYFMRQITKHTLLYTEMVTARALVHGDAEKLLWHSPEEYPLALQLGGNEPELLYKACQIANKYPYFEINLNLGCPSDRVKSGAFGAALMADPVRVRECLMAMLDSGAAVGAKIRIGIDDQDPDETLLPFVSHLSDLPLKTLTVHARKAMLKGLSPKQNREIPPLDYSQAVRIKNEHPNQQVILNGGLVDLKQDQQWLESLDGIMYGRHAYHSPWSLHRADPLYFNQTAPSQSPFEAVRNCFPYLEARLSEGMFLGHFSRHILGLFQGQPGARNFRRILSEQGNRPGSGIHTIEHALEQIVEEPQ